MTTKKVPLSLSRNYVRDWTVEQAVRELIANALDQGDYHFNTTSDSIHIDSYGGTIPEDTLLLGNGSKTSGDSNIGQFNEGYKIALLVLCREGFSVEIRNGADLWTASLEYSDIYETECLHVTIDYDIYPQEDCVEIGVSGLSQYSINKIVENTLYLQDGYNYHETNEGTILLDDQHKGKVFVGGLFVDNFKSDYGYNFRPEDFPLDRDRKSLKPFDVSWQCSYIFDLYSKKVDSEEDAEKLINSLSEGDKALEYANISTNNEAITKAADKLYQEKYNGKVVVSNFDEYNDQREAGNKVEYVPNTKLVNVLKQTESYKTFSIGMNKVVKKDVPDLLADYLEKWQDELSTEAFNDFEDMVQEIEKLI